MLPNLRIESFCWNLWRGVSVLEMLRLETVEAKEWSYHDLYLQQTSELGLYPDGVINLHVRRGLKGHLHHSQQHPSPYTPAFLPWPAGGRDLSR